MEGEVEDEDLIQREDMVVTVSHKGYIKRVPLSAYRAQRRGGKGRAGMATREEDFVTRIFIANTHTPVLFFSSRGMAYKMKVWRCHCGAAGARQGADRSAAIREGREHHHHPAAARGRGRWAKLDVMFATNGGTVRRNKLSDFIEVRQNGKIAMKLDEATASSASRLRREQGRAADHGRWPGHPLSGHRRARVQGPRVGRRARHQARARATRSSRWRSSAISKPSLQSARPISARRT